MEGIWYRSHYDVFASGEEKFFVGREKGSGKKIYYEFSCYDSPQAFYRTVMKRKSPSYHELIPSWRARRIHFDLDCNIPIEKDIFITDLVTACAQELEIAFGILLDPTKVVILDSSSGDKTSVHLILTDVVALTPYECRKFCEDASFRLRRNLPSARYDYASYLDMAIYDKNRCFRLPFCTKRRQERYLVPIPFTYKGEVYRGICDLEKEEAFTMALIGVNDPSKYHRVHYDLPAEKKYDERILTDVDIGTVLELVQNNLTPTEWSCYEVGKTQPGSIELTRVTPGPCRVCGRAHDRQGARISVSETGRVNLVCWAKSNAPEYIGMIGRGEGTQFTSSSARTAGDIARKYLSLDSHYDSTRSSSDYVAVLIEKYGYVE